MRDVKRDELRWMLRRIARGLVVSPMALLVACTGYSCAPCPAAFTSVQGVSQEQLDSLRDGQCLRLCARTPPGRFYPVPALACRIGASSEDASRSDAFASDDAGPSAGFIECTYQEECPGGRRPASGVTPLRGQGMAVWLAEMTQLEAASVDAFAELRSELVAHQAPRRLIQETHRAEADEVLHAQIVGAFARRAGARTMRPNVVLGPPRPLFELAQHNASEGCVREAYGALAALHQAHNASSSELREGFLRIARDEARHALLSLELDDWMRSKLNAQQVRRLDDEREVAAHELACNVGHEDHETRSVLGLPDEERGRDLVRLCA